MFSFLRFVLINKLFIRFSNHSKCCKRNPLLGVRVNNDGLQLFIRVSSFRPYQKEVIEKIIDGKDLLIVMATGSGKSLW